MNPIKIRNKGHIIVDSKLIGGMKERGEAMDFIRGILKDNDSKDGFPHVEVDFSVGNKNSYLLNASIKEWDDLDIYEDIEGGIIDDIKCI